MDELPVLPGFQDMALRRMAEQRADLVRELVEQRLAAGLSQTEVAARMGTSQSAVARLESGATDARASTLERYAAAVGGEINWSLNELSERIQLPHPRHLPPRRWRAGDPVARQAASGRRPVVARPARPGLAPGPAAADPGLA